MPSLAVCLTMWAIRRSFFWNCGFGWGIPHFLERERRGGRLTRRSTRRIAPWSRIRAIFFFFYELDRGARWQHREPDDVRAHRARPCPSVRTVPFEHPPVDVRVLPRRALPRRGLRAEHQGGSALRAKGGRARRARRATRSEWKGNGDEKTEKPRHRSISLLSSIRAPPQRGSG